MKFSKNRIIINFNSINVNSIKINFNSIKGSPCQPLSIGSQTSLNLPVAGFGICSHCSLNNLIDKLITLKLMTIKLMDKWKIKLIDTSLSIDRIARVFSPYNSFSTGAKRIQCGSSAVPVRFQCGIALG